MPKAYAFIDESGNASLETDKNGASRYYILVSIISDENRLPELQRQAEELRRKHFQSGEMKSSGIKDKDRHHRRIQILKDIQTLDFKYYAMAFNKEAIRKDSGLKYKKSFIKFCNELLYRKLFAHFDDIKITADAHGSSEFITSFLAYMEGEKPDLFWKSDCDMVASHSNILVQLADLVAGTMAKRYEGKSNPALDEAYRNLLDTKALGLDEWPTVDQLYFEPDKSSLEFDTFIKMHSISKAEDFLSRRENFRDEEGRAQAAVLSYLLFRCRYDPHSDYVGTHSIISHLQSIGFSGVSEQTIRSGIVAPLRDKGVLISSCSKGYKIPKAHADLLDFINRVDSQIVPLLERLNLARNSYLLGSQGQFDLLKGLKYPRLVALLRTLEEEGKKLQATPIASTSTDRPQ